MNKRLSTQMCVYYAVVVGAIVVAILYIISSSNEAYQAENVDFLTRRQCYFRQPDDGQLSYAGCRCSRVGTQMNNGVVVGSLLSNGELASYGQSGLYLPPL